jgi:hypothetical protein
MAEQIVFIDSRVGEISVLLNGLDPSVRAFVLNEHENGLHQMADLVAEHRLFDLATLSIVAHGEPGTLMLGATQIDEKGLRQEHDNLIRIELALAFNAKVLLYSCNVALGNIGRNFINQFSALLGGVPVMASTRRVGCADLGGSWHLDQSTAPIHAFIPFKLETLRSYNSVLGIKFIKGNDTIGDTGQYDSRMVFGDFDSDGDIDIIYQNGNTAGAGIGYKKNNGNGTFTDYTTATATGTPFTGFDFSGRNITNTSLSVVDINNDGRTDIIDRTNNSTQIWLQGSNGVFVKGTDTIGDIGLYDARTVFGDYDSDGDVDILYQNGNTAGAGIGYKKNNGNGTFTDYTTANAAGTPFTGFDFNGRNISNTILSAIDINNDGRTDIVDRTNDSAQIWLQGSNGVFVKGTDTIGDIGLYDSRTVFGDYDSDGDVDILYQNGNTSGAGIGYKKNNGNGTFTDYTDATAAGTPFAGFDFSGRNISNTVLSVVDIDHDGDDDIVDRSNGSTQIWLQVSDNPNSDGSPPILVSTAPSDNAINVLPTANITLTFDEAVTRGTGNIEIVRISTGAVIETIAVGSANVTGSGTTWTINPTNDLAGGVEYGMRIASGTFVDSDGMVYSGNAASAISFTTQANTPPTLNVNAGSTVLEGGTDTISATELAFTDAEQAASAITYTVTSAVTNGTLFRSGIALGVGASFTQDDINNNRITYTHNGGETTTASFGFSVSDGVGGSVTGRTFTFTVTPVNDAPTATGLTQSLILAEDGAAAALFTTAPTIVDVDSTSVTATLTLSNAAAGALTGATATATPGVYTLTGTPQQVQAALAAVKFDSADNYSGTLSASVGISDGNPSGPIGTQPSGTVSITVNPVSDAPSLTVLPASGNEDTAIALSIAAALVDPSEILSITIGSVPAGAVLSAGTNNQNGTWTLTQAQLTGLTITPPSNSDAGFTLTVTAISKDGTAAAATTTRSLAVIVNPVNDAPSLTGTKATLPAGRENTTYTVTASQLLAGFTDIEGSTLTVVNLTATNGTVKENVDGSYTIIPAAGYTGLTMLTYGISDGTAITPTTQMLEITEQPSVPWHNATSGNFFEVSSDGNSLRVEKYINAAGSNWKIAVVQDFNGDGRSDILWRNEAIGSISEWQGSNAGFVVNTYSDAVNSDWMIEGTGDFNGDGKSDILWRDRKAGAFAEWQGADIGFDKNSYVDTVSADWIVGGIGDFNGDGKSDILWFNKTNGTISEWKGGDSGFDKNAYVDAVDADLIIGGIGDFNGDGKSDILWQDKDTGMLAEWQGADTGFSKNTFVEVVRSDWTISGISDFSGDGKSDILWRNGANGTFTEWQGSSTGFDINTYIGTVGADWIIGGVNDFNGDGRSDILWYNADNTTITEWQGADMGFNVNIDVNNVGIDLGSTTKYD